ncbi:hypothetical protein Lal_00002873 [Lupinus albus]|uniref:Uncharacterized protein n=1 Tax=Lupinus albus TaxID=3870 RepID=A0A6A4NNR8_LUPAL|nr:hypothetical protein Lalb_Chr22g0352851 [Lupinus albus]KAF1882693.1 hypothetical protein Lal_00002873 [Lupinus albus]
MCYPGVPFGSQGGLVVQRKWIMFQGALMAGQVHGGGSNDDNSSQGGSGKRCVCSPSQHPGSFRCRQHHDQYVWRGRRVK